MAWLGRRYVAGPKDGLIRPLFSAGPKDGLDEYGCLAEEWPDELCMPTAMGLIFGLV